MSSAEESKRAVGRRAAELVEDGMVVGLGTGSTARHLVDRLGERVAEGLNIRCVPTSERTARQAAALGIPLLRIDQCDRLDLAIDGADQIDPRGQLIKGLGGALYREKRVARKSREFVVIADPSKEVERLGVGCPVPVEVPETREAPVAEALRRLGADPAPRRDGDVPYVTDNGNRILDASFDGIPDPALLEREINAIPGVLDNGLFVDLATRILIGDPQGVREWVPPGRL